MNRLAVFWITSIGGLAGVIALTLLVGQTDKMAAAQHPQKARAVFTAQVPYELTEANLVDTLSQAPFNLPLSRAEWKNGTLSLDFKVLTASTSANDIYRCIADAAELSFEGSTNVNRLMLRLVAEDQWMGRRHLLLAADLQREDYAASSAAALGEWQEAILPEMLQQQFNITYTKLWRIHFETF